MLAREILEGVLVVCRQGKNRFYIQRPFGKQKGMKRKISFDTAIIARVQMSEGQ